MKCVFIKRIGFVEDCSLGEKSANYNMLMRLERGCVGEVSRLGALMVELAFIID